MTLSVLETRPKTDSNPDSPLGSDTRHALADLVLNAVSDSYVLMVKTQAVHWNVTGPLFKSLHDLTEGQYQDLFAAIDDLAERIRALGLKAPMTYDGMQAASEIEPFRTERPTAGDMIAELAADNDKIAKRLILGIEAASRETDPATEDILTERLRAHQKASWMLRAMLETA
ncbi:MAG: DNA starvation/stationary phase protection protein [Pseudomonadota bacterium]